MVESRGRDFGDLIDDCIAEAQSRGYSQESIVSTLLDKADVHQAHPNPLPEGEDCIQLSMNGQDGFLSLAEETIYDELPPGLIDVPRALRKYGLNRGTLRRWIDRGHLKTYGRLRGRAPGGGYLLLRECDLQCWMNTPRNKGGRPRKAKPVTA